MSSERDAGEATAEADVDESEFEFADPHEAEADEGHGGDGAADFHDMREPRIEKVVVHMGVGEGGRDLADAESILAELTGQSPVRTTASSSIGEFDIREGDPIGAKVTLRGGSAEDFLERALAIYTPDRSQFDETGNVSFGIEEHTDFPSQEYDPNVGIYGLDVTVTIVRPGYRVSRRDKATRSIPDRHRVTVEDAVRFVESHMGVTIDDGEGSA